MLASRFTGFAAATVLLSGVAHGEISDEALQWHERAHEDRLQPSLVVNQRDAMGLPGLRPRLTMSVPLDTQARDSVYGATERSSFSWSLEAWQLNTASLAHIQCRNHTLTLDSFLAEDCRFVDQPIPENSVNLVQVRGEWMAAPGLNVGLSAFRNQQTATSPSNETAFPTPLLAAQQPMSTLTGSTLGSSPIDGIDLNVSFGLSTERIGDFLVGLQVARYRQRMSLAELGMISDDWIPGPESDFHYANSAQLSLGWRRGSLRGDILGHHRDAPFWLSGNPGSAHFNSFDLEFSWRPRNAALSIGISNVLDSAPRIEDNEGASMDDPMEQVFGRIPYVRYKHDL